jgi:HTH-type transcriptional regulator/antitoxin MqsA
MSSEPMTEARIRCPVCGKGQLEQRIITDRFDYREGKRQIAVVAENVPVQVCSHCQETFSGPEAGLIRHRAICQALGLLTPEEIGAIRERLGLSQAEFAKLTGIGEATISRWERGRLLQNKAMDRYLRLLATNPDNVRILRDPPQPSPVTPDPAGRCLAVRGFRRLPVTAETCFRSRQFLLFRQLDSVGNN